MASSKNSKGELTSARGYRSIVKGVRTRDPSITEKDAMKLVDDLCDEIGKTLQAGGSVALMSRDEDDEVSFEELRIERKRR